MTTGQTVQDWLAEEVNEGRLPRPAWDPFHRQHEPQCDLRVAHVSIAAGGAVEELGHVLPRVLCLVLGRQVGLHERASVIQRGERHKLWDNDRSWQAPGPIGPLGDWGLTQQER